MKAGALRIRCGLRLMRRSLAVVPAIVPLSACAQNRAVSHSVSVSGASDTLSIGERARIVEAVIRFRQLVFPNDTTARFDACSVALSLGLQYEGLLGPDVRAAISRSRQDCRNSEPAAIPILLLRSIREVSGGVMVEVGARGRNTNPHDEEYTVRKPIRPGDPWFATELRVYGVVILD